MFGRVYQTADSQYGFKKSRFHWQQWSLSAHPQGHLYCLLNNNVWIYDGKKTTPARVDRASIVTRPSGMTALDIEMITFVPQQKGNLVFISNGSIPAQTWSTSRNLTDVETQAMTKFMYQLGIEALVSDAAGTAINTESGQKFLLVNYHLADKIGSPQIDSYNGVITLLLRKTGGDTWKLESDIRDAYFKFPFVDVDGDGMPEFMGEKGFRSEVLRSLDRKANGAKGFSLVFDSGL